MNKIKLIKTGIIIDAIFEVFDHNIVILTFTDTIPSKELFNKGFTVDDIDYSEFNTTYKIQGDAVCLSNDKSVFIETPKPKPSELSVLTNKLWEIEAEFKTLDYIGVKIATGRGTIEEYSAEIDRMNKLAEIKKEIEIKIANIVKKGVK